MLVIGEHIEYVLLKRSAASLHYDPHEIRECGFRVLATYEIFAASWPNFPDKDDPMGSKLNALPGA